MQELLHKFQQLIDSDRIEKKKKKQCSIFDFFPRKQINVYFPFHKIF